MAGTDVRKLLLKLGIDRTDYKAVWSQIIRDVDTARSKESAAADKALASLQKQLNSLKESLNLSKQQVTELEKEAAQRERLVSSTSKEIALLKDKLSVQKQLHQVSVNMDARAATSARMRQTWRSNNPYASGALSKFGGLYGSQAGPGGLVGASNDLNIGKSGLLEYANNLSNATERQEKFTGSVRGSTFVVRGILNELGLRGNYVIARWIGGMQSIQSMLGKAFTAIGIIAVVEMMAQIPTIIAKITAGMVGWDEAAQKAAQSQEQLNQKYFEAAQKTKLSNVDLAKIGLTGVGGAKQELIDLKEKAKILGLQATAQSNIAQSAERERNARYGSQGSIRPTGLLGGITTLKNLYDVYLGGKQSKEELEGIISTQGTRAGESALQGKDNQEEQKRAAKELTVQQQADAREAIKATEDKKTGVDKANAELISNSIERENRLHEINLQGFKNQELQADREALTGKDMTAEKTKINQAREEEEIRHNQKLFSIAINGMKALAEAQQEQYRTEAQDFEASLTLAEDALKDSYDRRLLSFTDYLAKRENIAQQRAGSKIGGASLERAAGLADLYGQYQSSAGGMSPDDYAAAYQKIQSKYIASVNAANAEVAKVQQQNSVEVTTDQRDAEKTRSQQEIETRKATLDLEKEITEKYYKNDFDSFSQYRQRRIDEIERQRNLEEQDALIKFSNTPDKLQAQAELEAARAKTSATAAAAYQQLSFEGPQSPQLSPFGRAYIPGVGTYGSTLQAFRQYRLNRGQLGTYKGLDDTQNRMDYSNTLKDTIDALNKFQQGLLSVVQTFSQAAAAFGGSQKLQSYMGAVGAGGSAGTGLISMLQNNSDSGIMSSLNSFATGPAAIIAPIAGGIFGAISDYFKRAAQKVATDISNATNLIQRGIQSQNITVEQGLQQLSQERETAINKLSHMKGGQAQLDQLLPQLDQQIFQLQLQQEQVTRQLTEQIQMLSGPMGYQDQIASLQQIIDQYRQYYLTVGNSAQAYQYLQLAITQFVNTQNSQLAQSQENAIQDALQLNDLEYQRQILIQQTAQQEWDILTQGVLVRRSTAAQNKMYQLDILKQQTDMQLQTMDQQIQSDQYRVQLESQIFTISTDRIALENQLTQAQMQVINYDMQRIAALKDVVATVSDLNKNVLTNALTFDQVIWYFNNLYQQYAQMGLSGFTGITQ